MYDPGPGSRIINLYSTGLNAQQKRSVSFNEFVANTPKVEYAKVIHAAGNHISGGNVTFDFTGANWAYLMELVTSRGQEFTVQFGQGEERAQIVGCQMEAFSLNSGSNSLVGGSISFKATDEWVSYGYTWDPGSQSPYVYWQTGNTTGYIKNWNININRNLIPRFHNDGSIFTPRYIRVGRTYASMQITCIRQLYDGAQIKFIGNALEINGVITERSLQAIRRGSITEYSYSVDAAILPSDVGGAPYYEGAPTAVVVEII